MAPNKSTDWKEIAEQVTLETDPEKLLTLVRQLTDALDEHSKLKSQRIQSANSDS